MVVTGFGCFGLVVTGFGWFWLVACFITSKFLLYQNSMIKSQKKTFAVYKKKKLSKVMSEKVKDEIERFQFSHRSLQDFLQGF